MSVVPYTRTPTWVALQNPTLELANQIAGTDFVPASLRNNPAAITAAILYGNEVGLGPMQSLARIAVINGRPTLAAETQRALILAAGHDLWIEETTVTKCTVAGRRVDSDATSRVTWTIDDARRAGLAGKQPWRMYPRQMLLARASAELARAVFPDAIGGLAATEEIDDTGQADDGTTPAEPPTTKRTRKRASVTAPATTPPPPEPPQLDGPPVPGDLDAAADHAGPAAAAAAGEPAPPLSGPQKRKLFALFRELGISDRGERLDYAAYVIGRPIDSSNDLTLDEAAKLIDHLENEPSA